MMMTPTGKADEKSEYSLAITFVVMILFVFIWFFSIKRKYSLAFEFYALFSGCCKICMVVRAVLYQVSCMQKSPCVFTRGFQHHTCTPG